MTVSDVDAERWSQMAKSTSDWLNDFCESALGMIDLPAVLSEALDNVRTRRQALIAILATHQSDELLQRLFPRLVEVASVGHADVVLARRAISLLPQRWIEANIVEAASMVLATADASELAGAPEEEYRRLAELFDQRCPDRLPWLLERAAKHPNPQVREIAEDFR